MDGKLGTIVEEGYTSGGTGVVKMDAQNSSIINNLVKYGI